MVEYFRYENEDALLVRSGEKIIAKNKASGRIVETSLDDFTRNLDWKSITPRVKWRSVVMMILGILVLLTATMVQAKKTLVREGSFVLSVPLFSTIAAWFFCYTIGQTFLHEMAHVLSFRLLGGRPDKFGFCFDYYVVPSVYVRMNDLVLLLPSERAAVHLAGIAVNSMINYAVCVINMMSIHNSTVTFLVGLFAVGIVINFLPVLNSDGYKALLSIFDIHEKKDYRKNSWVVISIKILSWILITLIISSALFALIRKVM